MKRSEFKKAIKEEILDILESASQNDVKAQQDYNAELEKTAQLTKDLGLGEGNDTDKFQDDGYVNKQDVDDTTDLYVHNGGEDMAFESVNEEDDEEKEPTSSQLKKEPLSKIGYKLADTQKEMKQVVKKWKNSEGGEKQKLTDRLRELTKIKKELEGLL
tara:strand:- start:421 stop:897 length:477 start_codon:yes stop_codon:yes gene_type:complete